MNEVAVRRNELLEAAAEADDEVLTKYLEGEAITDAELEACLHKGVRDSILAPVLLTSSTKDIGMEELLDAIVRDLPSPEEEDPSPPSTAPGRRSTSHRTRMDRSWSRCSRPPPTRSWGGCRCSGWVGHVRSHDHVWNAAAARKSASARCCASMARNRRP